MSCPDFEMKIYVYDELSSTEREAVNAHLLTCPGCSALFEEIKQTQLLIRQVAEEKIIPSNAARLTSNIMAGITQPAKSSLTETMLEFLFSRNAKYALSLVSSALILVFCLQAFDDSAPAAKTPKTASFANSVILNAKHFRENFSRSRERRALFADCRTPFQSGQYDKNCIKSKMK